MVKVSVIMPVYNGEQTLVRAIDSVRNQTFQDWELIICDDCSSDNSIVLLQDIEKFDNRIKVVRNDTNLGVAEARNHAISVAIGDFIAFLDCDDYWYEDKLARQFLSIDCDNLDLVYSSYHLLGSNNVIEKVVVAKVMVTSANVWLSNHIGMLTAVVRRDIALSVKFKSLSHEDYRYWIDLMQANPELNVGTIREPLAVYSFQNNNSLSGDKMKSFFWTVSVYKYYGWGIISHILAVLNKVYSLKRRQKIT